ncbi:MAG: C40 family peptidase [Mogibacterium sp.]|nr:C40 family peptidase [Mogibacterium sp.]
MRSAVLLLALVCLFVALPCNTAEVHAAAATVSIKSYNTIPSCVRGESFTVKGKLTSNKKIKRVEIGIVNASTGKWVSGHKYDRKIGEKTFNIKKASSALHVDTLPAGTYYYRIWVHPTGAKPKRMLNAKFTVAAPKTTLTEQSVIRDLTLGGSFTLRGKITSNNKITRVEVGVVSAATGDWVPEIKYDNKKVNAKSFDLAKADPTVVFGGLPEGTYYYRIYAHTSLGGVKMLVNDVFRVIDPEKPFPTSVDMSCGVSVVKAPEQAQVTLQTAAGTDCTVKATYNKVPNLSKSVSYNVKGKIVSDRTIKRIEVGVVNVSTGKWAVGAKYDNDEVNAKTFDLQFADSSVKFCFLPAGSYRYRIYVHLDNGVVVSVVNQPFAVAGTKTNAEAIEAACNWAVALACDNTFNYGTGDRAHRYGCYFCDTNIKKKGSEPVDGHTYERTYCCNPFVHAAFAHGAGDAVLLADCEKGSGIGMSKSSYTRYGCWADRGKPAYSQLHRGDVIVKSNHVVLYLGDGKIVQAAGEGWGENSITVSNFSESYYNTFSYVMRYTGTGGK